jgi:hypothetical protein
MKKQPNRRLKQSALTLALTAALAVMAQAAMARTSISTSTTGPYLWSRGDLTVNSTISGGNIGVAVGNSVGILTNRGTIGINNSGLITSLNYTIGGSNTAISNQSGAMLAS